MLAHAGPHVSPGDPLLQWQLEPPLLAAAAAALLYALGFRRRSSRSRKARIDFLWFGLGLAAFVVAFASPIATYDDELFWAHMVQHVLLLTIVPPLVLLGRPWATIGRALPPDLRRGLARLALEARPALCRLTKPPFALAAFCVVLVAWHLPLLYNATLRSAAIHELEHATFLVAGLLFWSQLIDSPPFLSRLDHGARAVYAGVAMLVGWVLAIVLATASEPLYSGYSSLPSRPGGISALADQHLAAGVMWVPGSLAFTAAIVVFVARWLDKDEVPRKYVIQRAKAEP